MPAEPGSAATRSALTRLTAPSVEIPLIGRWDPTTTTGTSTWSVRLRKYAVSSNDAVPWVTTTPAG